MPHEMLDKFPGYWEEKTAAGNPRYRVRLHGKKKGVIPLSVPPSHPDFRRQYWDARAGVCSRDDYMARLDRGRNLNKKLSAMLKGAKFRADSKGMEFSITVDDLTNLLHQQKGKCAASGVDLDLEYMKTGKRAPFAPSIDRLDNSRGYTPDNIRITSAIANTAIADWGEEAFLKLIRAMAE